MLAEDARQMLCARQSTASRSSRSPSELPFWIERGAGGMRGPSEVECFTCCCLANSRLPLPGRPKSPLIDFQPLTNSDSALAREKIKRECPGITRKNRYKPQSPAKCRPGRKAPARRAGQEHLVQRPVQSVDDSIHRAAIVARGVGQRQSNRVNSLATRPTAA